MFASRLKLVSKLIDLKKWEQNKKLPRIYDANVKKEIPKKCRIVQLAVRYTRSIPGRLPEVRVEVDEYFFRNKLDAYNQALLILHEQMYLIGKETGHQDSDEIRKTIALLVSENLRGYLVGAPNNAAASSIVQNLLNKIYGDYFRFFVEDPEDKPNFIPSGYTQYSRYLSFKSLLMNLRNRKGNCLKENRFETIVEELKKKEIQEKCSYWAVHPDYIHTFTTNEEAFLFVTRWILDRLGLIDNSEMFVVWEKENPSFMRNYQKSQLLKACQEIKTRDYQYFRPVMAKAREYCSSIK